MHCELAINQNFSGKDQKQKKGKLFRTKMYAGATQKSLFDLWRHIFSEGKNSVERKNHVSYSKSLICRYLSTETNGFSRTLTLGPLRISLPKFNDRLYLSKPTSNTLFCIFVFKKPSNWNGPCTTRRKHHGPDVLHTESKRRKLRFPQPRNGKGSWRHYHRSFRTPLPIHPHHCRSCDLLQLHLRCYGSDESESSGKSYRNIYRSKRWLLLWTPSPSDPKWCDHHSPNIHSTSGL